jgi:hypothetical protein
MGPRRTAMLLLLAAGPAFAQPAATPDAAATPGAVPAPGASTGPVMRIIVPPPVQWDAAMSGSRPALQQTATDFANLTGGITFGMLPSDANAHLLEPYPGLSWNTLPMANEYPGEVRYFGVPFSQAGTLRMNPTACSGAASYLVFLFNSNGLFRLSYRLTADKICNDTNEAAQEILARYVSIGQTVALSLRYRTGRTQVVDITDPTAGYLIPTRWSQGIN